MTYALRPLGGSTTCKQNLILLVFLECKDQCVSVLTLDLFLLAFAAVMHFT